jgi:AcrR family transcriptional regulator
MARAAVKTIVAEQPEPSERILQILTESARLFATAGYNGTSMRDIATACGISKSLLYHHFADKDEIFARIALGSTRELCEFVTARVPEDIAPALRVRAFMMATAEYFHRYRWVWLASTSSFWNDPEARRQKERMMWRDRYEGLLRQLLQDAINAGEMRAMDVPTAGRLILSALNWMHRWYKPEKELAATQIADTYFDMIFGGLKAELSHEGAAPAAAPVTPKRSPVRR